MTGFDNPGNDPYRLFGEWMKEAETHEINDPNAMCLATVGSDGKPSSRMVLLKGVDEDGFVFYTNSESRKGVQLGQTGVAALCFYWKSLKKQVRVEGTVAMIGSGDADTYFHSRPRGSRIASTVSDQSRPLDSRETFLSRVERLTEQYADMDIIPRPAHWNGYRVVPERIEFWVEGPFRMHDRFVFTADDNGGWDIGRLYP